MSTRDTRKQNLLKQNKNLNHMLLLIYHPLSSNFLIVTIFSIGHRSRHHLCTHCHLYHHFRFVISSHVKTVSLSLFTLK